MWLINKRHLIRTTQGRRALYGMWFVGCAEGVGCRRSQSARVSVRLASACATPAMSDKGQFTRIGDIPGGGGHFCGRLARFATSQGLLHLFPRQSVEPERAREREAS